MGYEKETGNLIKAGVNSLAPGSMDRAINSVPSMAAHYIKDLEPFKHCCIDSNNCDIYKKHRPTIIGNYWPRNILFGRGDPDFQTVDGLSYPFNGIGVFTLLKTTLSEVTNVEVSTRRVGDGSVVSGVALKHDDSNPLELYITDNGDLTLVMGTEINLDAYNSYKVGVFEVTISENKTVFKIEVDGVELIVQVLVTNKFFNLMTSVPPTFKYSMSGLMGYYDGDQSNDYKKPDGTVVTIAEEDFETLHSEFGESWRVEQSDWLFHTADIVSDISDDVSTGSPGFVPRYEVVFNTPQEEANAFAQCNGDTACMRDISLTGDFSFAAVFQALEESVRAAEVMNELYREFEPQDLIGDGDSGNGGKKSGSSFFSIFIISLTALLINN